jgi:tight adherence protein B
MGRDGQALVLLVAVLLVALAGIATYVTGAARRAELASRGGPGDEERALRRLLRRLDARLRRTDRGRRLSTWLSSAAVPISPVEFLLGCVGGTLALYLAGTLFLPRLMALIVAVACAVGAARAWVEQRRARRRDLFVAQLPDVARLLANGASAGLSLPAAIQLAARELDEPAATEMQTVIEELRVGQPVDEALDAMRRRLPSRELGVLMTTLVIQQRAGGDTVRALTELGHALEARKDLIREIKTLLSGAVFTSYLVVGIGVATIVLLNVMSPGVMREMATSLAGIAALVVAGVLWAIAFVLIRQTTKVDV